MKRDVFLKQLSKLVLFRTVSGNFDENSKALDYVESLVDKRANIERIKNNNEEIFIASNSKTMSPDVSYMVHIDVVAAKVEQFILKEKGDRLIGRGASDMKFSIPIGVSLLNHLIENQSNLAYSLVITTDEEMGGFNGVKYLAEKLKFRPKCLIVPDGGDNLNFVSKAKGVCHLTITSYGSPAHASRPWMGKNAMEPVIKLASKLIEIYGKNNLRENWGTTLNIGQIHGGVSSNQVCPEAVMKLDFRYSETDSIEKIVSKVEELAGNINKGLKINLVSSGLPTFTDPKLPIVKKFLESMEMAYGSKIRVSHTYGASDARHFAKYNIPILMLKPLGGEIHSDTEWVSLSSSLTFHKGLENFLSKLKYKTTLE